MRQLLFTAIVGSPFLAVAAYTFPLDDVPLWGSSVILLVGFVLLIAGIALSRASRTTGAALLGNEEILVKRHPSMKPAYARMVLSIPFLVAALVLFEFTFLPYVYSFVFLVAGLFLFFRGAVRYWVNHFTTYYVTARRVIYVYEFLWLRTSEIPISRVVSISEARNVFEVLTGRGSIVVASGFGRRQNVHMHDIDDPSPVAQSVRALLPE